MRIGHGYDVHAFGGDKPLILGGVTFKEHQGLIAHSDGDVLLHALCDALLGAAALGDIGKHFPDDQKEFKNIDSRKLLINCFQLISKQQYRIGNIDITVIAQTPRMSENIEAIKENLMLDLLLPPDQINIKATTTEKLGYIGRKEGIAVHCVCLLESS
ncbi:MAG: 2-C-methyl-D-erythritol 2,4-cyclodiphosphate synthase [Enterobacterales bacterium]|nr:2-C-methyl-D-erythritol 2,4-cyclodiphosphate synthase [Enterobacterales bacterium]